MNVLITTIIAFGIMYPIAEYVADVATYNPPVMMSLLIAMNIDYSLFLLSRYKEELRVSADNNRAVKRMIVVIMPTLISSYHCKFAGRIVASSGGVLFLCFFGLILFPLSFISSFGMSGACSIVYITHSLLLNDLALCYSSKPYSYTLVIAYIWEILSFSISLCAKLQIFWPKGARKN